MSDNLFCVVQIEWLVPEEDTNYNFKYWEINQDSSLSYNFPKAQ